jgi:spermidine/putrescine transport system ATP-binding protein
MVSAATAAALEVRGVSKIFPTPEGGEVRALDDVSLDIAAGEFFILLGPSGCGKTTLLRLIAGLEYPDAGEIMLGGERLDLLPPWKRNVNTVFQSYALFPHMTIAENIAFGLEMEGADKATISARVKEMLDLVRLTGYESRRPSQLSGGQQQRVALARALAKRPSVLLLDEPLSALDLKLRRGMQVELKAIQQQTGVTFVFVTHDQEEAMSMGDRIAVFSNGQIAQLGTPRDIYEHPVNSYVADFVGETNLLTAAVEFADGEADYRIEGSGKVAHRNLDVSSPAPESGQDTVLLAVRPEH